jgi:phosphomannomutase
MSLELTEADQLLLQQARHWIADDPEPITRAELTELLDTIETDSDDAEAHGRAGAALTDLRDRFNGTLQFGTAGLRGRIEAGPNRMNRSVVIRAAAGLGAFLKESLPGETPTVAIGYDARHFSQAFALDSAAVLTAAGCEVYLLPSALSTPVLAYTMRRLNTDAGIVVTASHNPPQDNGYKVYLGGRVVTGDGQGAQIVPPYDGQIAAKIAAVPSVSETLQAPSGWITLNDDAVTSYVDAVVGLKSDGPRDLTAVLTPLHGVGGQVVERVLSEAGFERLIPVAEQYVPDPDFPTVTFPNPEEPGAIDLSLEYAFKNDADIVIANDPDTDRCAAAVKDPRVAAAFQDVPSDNPAAAGWRMLHGDEVGSLLGNFVASRYVDSGRPEGRLRLANSIVSSRLLGKIASAHGLNYSNTLTGFKWIARAPQLLFGYEEALGYCVAPNLVRDKDGISAALLLAELAALLKSQGRTIIDYLDDLAREHGLYLTDQLSARFSDLSRIPATMSTLRSAPPATLAGSPVTQVADLAEGYDGLPPTDGLLLLAEDGTRVIVRPSGTEPKVKCYMEVIENVASDASFDDLTVARAAARARMEQVRLDMKGALGL